MSHESCSAGIVKKNFPMSGGAAIGEFFFTIPAELFMGEVPREVFVTGQPTLISEVESLQNMENFLTWHYWDSTLTQDLYTNVVDLLSTSGIF